MTAIAVKDMQVGQLVITDTMRPVVILRISTTYDAALIQFPNGRTSWWPMSTLEPLTPDKAAVSSPTERALVSGSPDRTSGAVGTHGGKPASGLGRAPVLAAPGLGGARYEDPFPLGRISDLTPPYSAVTTLRSCPARSTALPSPVPRRQGGGS